MIFGHTRQREALRSLTERKKLPSALIFGGPSGIGKSLVASELARTLLCKEGKNYGGCGKCKGCKQFDTKTHPDFHRIECSEKEESNVEALREMLRKLSFSAFEGAAKIIFVNDAEMISLQGANILLKTLEEPGKDTYFLLISTNPGKLPATILSRCQRWYFNPLTSEDLAAAIKNAKLDTGKATPQEIALLSDGSLGNLSSVLAQYEEWLSLSKKVEHLKRGDLKFGLDLAKELAADRETLREKLALLRIVARQKLSEAAADSTLALRFADLLRNIMVAEQLIFERNLNAGYLLSAVFSAFSGEGADGIWSDKNPTLIEEMVVAF